MKARKILGLVSEKYKDPSLCEACGEEFTCGASLNGCWCVNVNLSDENRAELKQKFNSCLCPNCLKQVASYTVKGS